MRPLMENFHRRWGGKKHRHVSWEFRIAPTSFFFAPRHRSQKPRWFNNLAWLLKWIITRDRKEADGVFWGENTGGRIINMEICDERKVTGTLGVQNSCSRSLFREATTESVTRHILFPLFLTSNYWLKVVFIFGISPGKMCNHVSSAFNLSGIPQY